MSLQWQLSRKVPEDTARVGHAILKEGNIYRQIGDRFDALFPEEEVFASLYDTQGRGAIPPLLMALVTVFQMLEKVPDRMAAEWVVSRLDWKYALHLPLGYTGFHFTDLYAFRQRLLAHGQERLVFDQVLENLKGWGLIKGRGKMRSDSTHVLGVIERLSQFELVAESLRVALRAVMTAAPDWAERALPESFCDLYLRRQSEYGLSDAQVQERLLQTGKDAFWFVAYLDQAAPEAVRHLPEVEVLRIVLEQQFPSGSGGAPAGKRPTGKMVIESPHEPEVRYGTKRGQGWLGYKLQVTETCDDDHPRLIVDLEPTGALDNDSPELPHIQARLKAQDTLPGEHYVDQGYMSGQGLVTSAEQGINLMGIPLADTQAPSGFGQADFDIHEAQQQATCPDEQTSTVWSEHPNPEGTASQIQIRFDGKRCQACRFFGLCTTSPQGRSLTLHPYRSALAARRAEAQTPAFRDKLHVRAGIEATISELVRAYRLRYARYRGLPKLRLQAYFTTIALNLKRLGRWWMQAQAVGAAG